MLSDHATTPSHETDDNNYFLCIPFKSFYILKIFVFMTASAYKSIVKIEKYAKNILGFIIY